MIKRDSQWLLIQQLMISLKIILIIKVIQFKIQIINRQEQCKQIMIHFKSLLNLYLIV